MSARQFQILEAARQFSAIWDLRYPTLRELQDRRLRAIDSFWWRLPFADPHDINKVPDRRWREVPPADYDTPEADRKDCMSAIVGTLYARGFLCRHVRDLLRISLDVHARHLEQWQNESIDYRWIICCMRADLSHRALRNLVLGYPRAC